MKNKNYKYYFCCVVEALARDQDVTVQNKVMNYVSSEAEW